jgi:small subunit ribosomal protein S20
MPIKHAALKQIRKDRTRAERNHSIRESLKTAAKRLRALLKENKSSEAAAFIRQLAKQFDHAASKGVIHRNTAARVKSRFMQRLHHLTAVAK